MGDLIRDKEFKDQDFTGTGLPKGEYENCTFQNCDFSESDLKEVVFLECEFSTSNLSSIKTTHTAFREVLFKDCKMLGIRFDACNEFLFSVDFEGCMLNLSSFYGLPMKDTSFRNCSIQENDFAGTDLTNSVFENADLTGTMFENTNLENADFRTAFNYSIDPETNRLKKTKFSREGIQGLLHKYDILIE